jgi:hypothetical protein
LTNTVGMGFFISVESAEGVQTFSKHLRLVVRHNAVRVAVTTRPPQNVRRRAGRAELTRCQRVLPGRKKPCGAARRTASHDEYGIMALDVSLNLQGPDARSYFCDSMRLIE